MRRILIRKYFNEQISELDNAIKTLEEEDITNDVPNNSYKIVQKFGLDQNVEGYIYLSDSRTLTSELQYGVKKLEDKDSELIIE